MPPKVSKSGPIRKLIGPRRKRLMDYIGTADAIIKSPMPADNLKAAEVATIDTLVSKMEASIEGIMESDEEWRNLMMKLEEEDEITTEEAIYNSAMDGDDGVIIAIDDGRAAVKLLNKRMRRMVSMQGPAVAPVAAAVTADLDTSSISVSNRKSAKLPKLTLPTFNGDPLTWGQFWAIFASNVNNTDLDNVEKFAYLRGQLRDVALNAVEGLEVNNESYDIAVDILKGRFERSAEKMVGSLYSQLKKLPQSSSRQEDLQKTYDQTEKIFRQLKTAGENVDANRSLSMDVLSKYPQHVLKELARQKSVGNHSTVSDLQKALAEYLEQSSSLRDMFGDLQPFGNQTSTSKSTSGNRHWPNKYVQPEYKSNQYGGNSNSKFGKREYNSSALSTVDQRNNNSGREGPKPSNPCYFCQGPHYNSECTKYQTLDQRYKRLDALSRCRRCGGANHSATQCRIPAGKLECYFCKKSDDHTSALCPVKFATKRVSMEKSTAESSKNQKATESVCTLSFDEQSLLPTAVTTVTNPVTGLQRRVKIVLDSGSNRTYITEDLAKLLEFDMHHRRSVSVAAFGAKRSISVQSAQVELRINLKDHKSTNVVANTWPLLTTCRISPDNLPESTKRLVESMKFAMADDFSSDGPPDVLIGSDYFWDFISGERIKTDDGIYLIPSKLGMLLGGRFKGHSDDTEDWPSLFCLTERSSVSTFETCLSLISSECRAKQSYPDVDEFWSLESMGIRDSPTENDDDIALNQFNKTVYFENGRYHVSWPWKDNSASLPVNYQLALGRLKSLAKRLKESSDSLLGEYEKVIKTQSELGIIEKVPAEEFWKTENMVHYLPHHPVVRVGHATTKVRIVYDASAKCRKDASSLNECLFRGPVILPDLCSVIIRFRLNEIALIADIEKAFLQLSLKPSERDVTRFLWFEDTKKLDINNTEVYRFARVPFGIVSSPFLLGATIQHHLKRVGTGTAELISKNTYVDNVITGASSISEALQFYHNAKKIFADASMNLREWGSNSKTLVDHIPEKDRASSGPTKVLGLKWDNEVDTLQLQASWANQVDSCTKREVLQAIASIYDPLGFFQPCTLKAKCFLREIWKNNSGWDEKIDESLREKWKVIHADIAPIFDVKIPRYINSGFSCPGTEVTLAVFSDASSDAYAVSVYLRSRVDDSTDQWESNLVFAKSRLAPKQVTKMDISLPRLELLGLTIGAKAADFVRSSLQHPSPVKVFMFSDSTCVLGWLRTEKPLQTFVKNRITKIRALENAEFRHVRTNDNVADLSTRGVPGCDIAASKFWWNGPVWLQHNESEWPTKSVVEAISDADLVKINEEISNKPVYHTFVAGESLPEPRVDSYPFGIDPKKFSSFRKLVRISAWCMKFIKRRIWDRLSAKTRESHANLDRIFNDITSECHVTAAEVKESKLIWVKYTQRSNLADVFSALQSNRQHPLIRQLNIEIDNFGILRCVGRLKFADLSTEAIQPILLPKSDYITGLVIKETHERLFHSGVSHTLSQLRREYWVPQGRNAVRKIINRCLLCRRNKGPPFALPKMPPWPRERVSRSKAFQFCGVDYFGPVNVSTGVATSKMWVCLFTCLAVRAVHLEYVVDCTATSFINCLSRFISRRGAPEQIISDNAPQFKLASNLFQRTWLKTIRDETVQSYISDKGIRWKFITELAPWQGGFYERLVGIVKAAFKSVVGRKLLKLDDFITLMTEVESVVNSRPITYVFSDINSGFALRPMDFLTDLTTGTPAIDPTTRPEGGDAGKDLVRFWKSKQRRLDLMWKQWHDDYLLSLRERGQTGHRGPRSAIKVSPPELMEVVLVKNLDAPRGNWKLGKIVKVITGTDGSVRSVELRLPNQQTIRRPINHIYRLEIPTALQPVNDDTNDSSQKEATDLDESIFEGFSEEYVDEFDERARRLIAGDFVNIPPPRDNDDNSNQVALVSHTRSSILGGLVVDPSSC